MHFRWPPLLHEVQQLAQPILVARHGIQCLRVRCFPKRILGDLYEPAQPTAEELLRYYAKIFQIPRSEMDKRIDAVLKLVELEPVRKRQIKTFSNCVGIE